MESSFPKIAFEMGSLFLHGYDKQGYKICKSFHVLNSFSQKPNVIMLLE